MKTVGGALMPVVLVGWLSFGLAGCGIAFDIFNPGLFAQFGLDPASIRPATGTVIVNFSNQTQFPAVFAAYEAADSIDLTRDTRNFTVEVVAQGSRNEVIECPIELLSLGTVNVDGTVATLAAIVTTEGGPQNVMYEGAALETGVDFRCGDVIDVRLVAGVENAFALTVRVLPGR